MRLIDFYFIFFFIKLVLGHCGFFSHSLISAAFHAVLTGLAWGGSVCVLEVFYYYGCRVSACFASHLFCKNCMRAKGKFDQLPFSGSETIAKMQKQSNPFFWGLFKQELERLFHFFKNEELCRPVLKAVNYYLNTSFLCLYSKLRILICGVEGISLEIVNFNWCFQQMDKITAVSSRQVC